jgi:hypothetical protein
MTADAQDRSPAWTLAGGASDGTGAHQLEPVRSLTAEQAKEIRDAAEILTRISGQAQFTAIIDALKALHEAEARADPGEEGAALTGACEAASATIEALRRLAEALTTDAAQDLRADRAAASELTRARERAEDDPAWRAALAMQVALRAGDAELRATEGGTRLVIAGPAAPAAAEPGRSGVEGTGVREALEAALEVAQSMSAERLLACRQQIEDASRTLRGVASEVLWGEPLLLEHPADWPADETAGPLTPHRLPLAAVGLLQRAIRLADGLQRYGPDTSGETSPGADLGGQAGAGETDTPSGGAGEPEQPGAADEERPGVEAEQAQDAGQPPAQPAPPGRSVDLDALVAHVTTLSSELERAWSDALEETALGEAFQLLDGEWASLIATVAARAQDAVARAQAAGISPLIPHPQDPSNARTVSVHPTSDEAWRQLQLAEMIALERLLQALAALKSRHAAVLPPPGAEQEGWWQSGAFALVRLRARQLARAARALDAAEARLLAEQDKDAPSRGVQLDGGWVDRLELARAADSRGDPESTLIHLRLALRERAAGLAGCEEDALDESFERRLAEDPRLAALSGPLSAMCEASGDLGAGRPVNLGACLVLARFLIEPVSELCLGLGGELLDATRRRDDEPPTPAGAA